MTYLYNVTSSFHIVTNTKPDTRGGSLSESRTLGPGIKESEWNHGNQIRIKGIRRESMESSRNQWNHDGIMESNRLFLWESKRNQGNLTGIMGIKVESKQNQESGINLPI